MDFRLRILVFRLASVRKILRDRVCGDDIDEKLEKRTGNIFIGGDDGDVETMEMWGHAR